MLPMWVMAGVPVEDKPDNSQLRPPRARALACPKAAAWDESAFRLSLAWAQALAAQSPAELLWLVASPSGLNYMESQHPQAFIPAMQTHAFVVVGRLCSLCVCLLAARAGGISVCVVSVHVCVSSSCVCHLGARTSLVSMHMCHLHACLSSPGAYVIFSHSFVHI